MRLSGIVVALAFLLSGCDGGSYQAGEAHLTVIPPALVTTKIVGATPKQREALVEMRRALVVIALLLVAGGCGSEQKQAASDTEVVPSGPVVARVGDETVTVGEVWALLADAKLSFRKQGRPFPRATDAYYLDLRDQAVSYLVEAAAFRQEASRVGVEVDAADVDRELRRGRAASASARAEIERRLRDRGVFEVLVGHADERDNLGPVKRKWKAQVGSLVESARYADGWKPAEKLRSPTPQELQGLPKPEGPCDLDDGTFTLREAWAHGCVQAWGIRSRGLTVRRVPRFPSVQRWMPASARRRRRRATSCGTSTATRRPASAIRRGRSL